jgi:hypothetical protein
MLRRMACRAALCTPARAHATMAPALLPEPTFMFTPSSDDVRRFFCEAFRKQRAGEILTPMDAIAADWIARHPEYADVLSDAEAALTRDYSVEGGQANPFLHLSMHLSIAEQVSIDQPRGIRAAHDALVGRLGECVRSR